MSTTPDLATPDPVGQPDSMNVDAQAASAEDQVAATHVQLRTIVHSADASIIIGKGGRHINEIRQESGARLQLTGAVPGNEERILTVSGALEAVARAFGLLVRRLNEEPFMQPSLPGARAYTWRFVVPNPRMGSVIGKGGTKIKEIQEASGARVQAGENMLTGSTERILTITGVADSVHIAVYYVGLILAENQDRGVGNNLAYTPAAAAFASPNPPTIPPTGLPPASAAAPPGFPGVPPGGAPGFLPPGPPGTAAPPQGAPFGVPPPAGVAPPAIPRIGMPPPPGSQITQHIYIPDDLVGSVIGKGGAKINEIRQSSGTHIKITDPSGAPERLVTILGSQANIQIAVNMLHNRVEDERRRLHS